MKKIDKKQFLIDNLTQNCQNLAFKFYANSFHLNFPIPKTTKIQKKKFSSPAICQP